MLPVSLEEGTPRATLDNATSNDARTRRSMIEQAAYFRAEQRGFQPGYEVEDWLTAERELDGSIQVGVPIGRSGD